MGGLSLAIVLLANVSSIGSHAQDRPVPGAFVREMDCLTALTRNASTLKEKKDSCQTSLVLKGLSASGKGFYFYDCTSVYFCAVVGEGNPENEGRFESFPEDANGSSTSNYIVRVMVENSPALKAGPQYVLFENRVRHTRVVGGGPESHQDVSLAPQRVGMIPSFASKTATTSA